MRKDSFCARPGQCPVQGRCKRNPDNWEQVPPVRIYEVFHWIEHSGCDGFLDLSASLTPKKNPARARA